MTQDRQSLTTARSWVRVRTHHSKTQREGWRLDETTVEVTVPVTDSHGTQDDVSALLAAMQREVYVDGSLEANRRNDEEGR
jgi:hypothetical protein